MDFDRRAVFAFFLVSGFCGLLYQVVWVRIAYASFGVNTPVLSVVVSCFMLGLALGSFVGGRSIERWKRGLGVSALRLYAACEALIALGAVAVPWTFAIGEGLLLSSGESDSTGYLLRSAVIIGLGILPWCTCMGFTFPFMISYLREGDERDESSFSFLYLANVIGAVLGTLTSALVLIELFGFSGTLRIAALFNLLVAGASLALSRGRASGASRDAGMRLEVEPAGGLLPPGEQRVAVLLLFLTGFASMAMEVAWVRAFTPVLLTRTYSFAGLLAVYLLTTFLGSLAYRRQLARGREIETSPLLGAIAAFAFLPVVMNDPRIMRGVLTALLSIAPFCAALGYLTPMLIDRLSRGRAAQVGRYYAVNVAGSILGPLAAAYLLLPQLGVRLSLVLLAAPFLLLYLGLERRRILALGRPAAAALFAFLMLLQASFSNVSDEDVWASMEGSEVRRDHTATVVSVGKGMQRRLLVNGITMTDVTSLTKVMAHLPSLLREEAPRSGLAICLGIGTTYRSLLSWDMQTTAVELIPSVKSALPFYFGQRLVDDPRGEIIVDDGRRFLRRTTERFDVVTIDPPPPIEAAGSSLLYSEEFLELVKARLGDDGILQHWFPYGERKVLQAVVRSISNVFPHVRVYRGMERFGHHILASEAPLGRPSVEEAIARMPRAARADLVEWDGAGDPHAMLALIFRREIPLEQLLAEDERIVIRDDRPFNEYYLIRRFWDRRQGTYVEVR